MTISYPLSLPSSLGPADVELQCVPFVGMSESPFTGAQQTYDWGNDLWMARFNIPIMRRSYAEEWIAGFLLALHGRRGSFLMGEPGYTTPQGTWSGGSPLVKGASQTGESLLIDGMANGITGKAGDYFQLGSGASSRLYKLTKDFTVASNEATIDFTPKLRSSPADNAALTIASPVGLFMLVGGPTSWSIEAAFKYGLQFSAVEDLRSV